MAKITSSSPNRMPVVVDVPSMPSPVATQALPTAPSLPNMDESFADSKKKLMSLGRTSKTPAFVPDAPAGTFQVKDAGVQAAATKAKPSPANAFVAKIDGKNEKQAFAVFSGLSSAQRKAITDDFLKNPAAFQGSVAMAVVRGMNTEQLKTAVDQMRAAGGTKRTSFESAIAGELAARTSWGKSHPAVVDRMREGIASGRTIFATPAGGAAADTENGVIRLGEHLAISPEQLAATIAHESTHAENADKGRNLNKMSEETSGVDAEIAVFKELSAKNPDAFKGLSADDTARYNEYIKLTPAASHARTAGFYAQKAEELFTPKDADVYRNQVEQIVAQLAKEPDAVKALDTRAIRQLIDGVNQTGASMKDLGVVLKNASPDMKKEADTYLSGKENVNARAQLNAGMK